jgi:prepilin-type processing-associated H-X9-DG protein
MVRSRFASPQGRYAVGFLDGHVEMREEGPLTD